MFPGNSFFNHKADEPLTLINYQVHTGSLQRYSCWPIKLRLQIMIHLLAVANASLTSAASRCCQSSDVRNWKLGWACSWIDPSNKYTGVSPRTSAPQYASLHDDTPDVPRRVQTGMLAGIVSTLYSVRPFFLRDN